MVTLTKRLRQGKSVLIVQGDCSGLDHFLSVGFGAGKGYLAVGLDRITEPPGEVTR